MTASNPSGPFRLGAAEGVVPTKWVRTWGERLPQVPLELVRFGAVGGEEWILDGTVDAGIVRLPISRGAQELHVIPLYEEVPVVVVPTDHYLCAADEVEVEDLADEVVHAPADGVEWSIAVGVTPREKAPDTASAIQLVAAGVGVLVVPKSLARLHHRKDLTYRPVLGLPTIGVGLVWRGDNPSPLIEELIGVVRGRSTRSTRGQQAQPAAKRTAAEKAAARREFLAQRREISSSGSGSSRRSRGGRPARRRKGGR